MLASVFGEPALVHDGVAGCEAQHQQTAFAKKKQHDAVFFVNTARFGVRGARPPAHPSKPEARARETAVPGPWGAAAHIPLLALRAWMKKAGI
jgi:hypothetical protein